MILRAFSYRSVESILKHHLDEFPLAPEDPAPRVADHANVRGPAYYRQEPTESPVALADHDSDPTLN